MIYWERHEECVIKSNIINEECVKNEESVIKSKWEVDAETKKIDCHNNIEFGMLFFGFLGHDKVSFVLYTVNSEIIARF